MPTILRRAPDVPAPVALVVFLAAGTGIALLDVHALGVLVFLLWAAYTIARPTVGWGLFLLPLGLSFVAQAADWISEGTYWYVYGPLVPFAIGAAIADDREGRRKLSEQQP